MSQTTFRSQSRGTESAGELFSAPRADKLRNLPMSAIVLVDKPAGISSAEVVRRVKSRVKPVRVGHLG